MTLLTYIKKNLEIIIFCILVILLILLILRRSWEGFFNENHGINRIDAIIYINLENRNDRKELLMKELEKLNSAMGDNQRKQKDLIQSIKDTPSVAEQTKTVAPAGFKKFGIAGDETATLNRVLELEKKISETKDKRKLGPLQAELEYQNKVLEVQRSNNKELTKKQGLLTMLQSEESKLAAFADVQRDKQVEAMKASKDTSPTVLGL